MCTCMCVHGGVYSCVLVRLSIHLGSCNALNKITVMVVAT